MVLPQVLRVVGRAVHPGRCRSVIDVLAAAENRSAEKDRTADRANMSPVSEKNLEKYVTGVRKVRLPWPSDGSRGAVRRFGEGRSGAALRL
ncbi:MAG: hypothetical protein WA903_06865, partial [Ornithinimicrobium sp.]